MIKITRLLTRIWMPLFVLAIYALLYLPIIIMSAFSFNNATTSYQWTGFTFKWYTSLWSSSEIWSALTNSVMVSGIATFLSLAIGVTVVYSLGRHVSRLTPFFSLPALVPEVVLGVGFLYFFSFFKVPLGLPTLIVAHTLLGLAFAIPLISTRFLELDQYVIDASTDLGASVSQTFFKVVLPFLSPALIAAGLVSWILSFDDFLLSFFCAGTASQTLPLYIYTKVRVGVTPEINALSTLILLVTCIMVSLFFWVQFKTNPEES